MRFNGIILPLAWLLSKSAAISLVERDDAAPRVVRWELQRNSVRDRVSHDNNRLARRDSTVTGMLDNAETLYYLNISLGTPQQDFRLSIDTGSSDLWVNAADSDFCQDSSDPCVNSGTYDANSSSTYHYVGDWFNITYADGTGAAGDYATETLHLGGETVKDLQFGIGYTSSSPDGVLGVGYALNEAQTDIEGRRPYDNLPMRMVKQNLISSNAYSLYLDDLGSETGVLLFGGVDRAQYEGELVTLPIQRLPDTEYTEFLVTLTGVEIDGDNVSGRRGMAAAALLDSGTSLTYLPDDMTSTIFDEVGAVYDSRARSAVVPCSLADADVNMTFRFSNSVSIDVGIRELVLPVASTVDHDDSSSSDDPSDDSACLFGVAPSSSRLIILGDTFLRSAYVVYDLDNNEISLAQSLFNVTESDVAEIGTGSNAVPSAAEASTTVTAASGLPAAPTQTSDDNDDNGAGLVAPSWSLVGFTASLAVVVGLFGCAL